MKPWYIEMFENYAEGYDRESYTHGTLQEVDFIETELKRVKCISILDIGCGTGRHSIELARRGYSVTGFDLSEAQLAGARKKAAEAGVNVRFMHADARDFSFPDPFDAAIMICEGAFPLMETDEMNHRILENAAALIRPGGLFILTTLNALFPIHNDVNQFITENSVSGFESIEERFDLLTFRSHSRFTFTDDAGIKKTMTSNERYYVPSEIAWMLKGLGFERIEFFGCDTGNFSRGISLTPSHYEMLVIAEKKKA